MSYVYNDGGRAAAGYDGRTGDCVTRAISIATGLSYQSVYDALNDLAKTERTGKRKRKISNSRTGVHRSSYERFLRSIGWVWIPTMKVGSGCKVHLDASELPAGRLIVSVSRHLTAMIDGVIHDTSDPRRGKSYNFEPDKGQELKANQGRNQNGVWTEIGGRCVYGYYKAGPSVGEHYR